MMPMVFNLIPAFFFMITIASLVATFAATRWARRDQLSEIVVLDMAIIAVSVSMIGARIFHVLVEAPDYYGIFWQFPWPRFQPELFVRVFYFWQGGFVSLGAFIATIGSWILYLRIRRQAMLPYFDLMAQVVPIIIFFVRVGCWMAGCCYGKPTDFFLYLVFSNPGSAAYSVYPNIPLHAAQIYAMLNAVVMMGVIQWVHRRRRFYGQDVATFLMYYGLTRALIEETLRGDADRGVYSIFGMGISTGQIVMTGFFVAGLAVYLWCRKRYPL